MDIKKFIWVESCRPSTLDEVILPTKIKSAFKKYVEQKEIPHLLFYGAPGSGKTSLAEALAHDIESDCMYINASEENGIDTLRSKVTKFASSRGIYNNKAKVIILDECDGTTENFQKALRPVMERFAVSCRFILTANYPNKIIPAIHDRCQAYNFNYTPKEIEDVKGKIVKRLKSILSVYECTVDETVLADYVDAKYPSIRKMIQDLQRYAHINNNVIDSSIFNFNSIDDQFYQYIFKKDAKSARKYIIESSIDPEEFYSNLYQTFLPLIEDNEMRYAQSLITINDYQYRSALCIDKELCLAACIIELCAR